MLRIWQLILNTKNSDSFKRIIFADFLMVSYTSITYFVFERSVGEYNIKQHSQFRKKVVKSEPLFARWDSFWHKRISEHGYQITDNSKQNNVGFFPFYGSLMRGVSRITGASLWTSGVWISRICAFVLLLLLGEHLASFGFVERQFQAAQIALLAFPTAFILVSIYSESLFLMLCLASVVLSRRGCYGWAAISAGLAALTHPHGAALWAYFAVFGFLEQRRGGKNFKVYLPALAVILATSGLFAYFWIEFGDFFLYVSSKKKWSASVGIPGEDLERHLVYLFVAFSRQTFGSAVVVLNIASVCLLGTGAYYLIKKKRFPEASFIVTILAISLSQSSMNGIQKFCIFAFPLALLISPTVLKSGGFLLWIALSGVLQGFCMIRYANYLPPPF